MSLARQVMKLRGKTPFIRSQRTKSGFPNTYIPGGWGDCSHVMNGAPTQRMPLWQKMAWGTVWCTGMFTYPFYVTYMMYEWDRLDENM